MGVIFQGDVKSEQSGAAWKASVKFTSVNETTGDLSCEMSWPSLNSVHRIDGKIQGNRLTFTENGYIKRGNAHLNCQYDLTFDGNNLRGSWAEPGQDRGSINFMRQ